MAITLTFPKDRKGHMKVEAKFDKIDNGSGVLLPDGTSSTEQRIRTKAGDKAVIERLTIGGGMVIEKIPFQVDAKGLKLEASRPLFARQTKPMEKRWAELLKDTDRWERVAKNPPAQKAAATPEQAVESFAAALKAGDMPAALELMAEPFQSLTLLTVLGEEADDIRTKALDE